MGFLYLALALSFGSAAQLGGKPSVVVSVWYNGPATQPPAGLKPSVSADTLRQDLAMIRGAGFNGVTTWISWRDGEPRRGVLALTQLDRLVELASAAGLHVDIEVYTEDQPAWKKDGSNALAGQFYQRVSARYSDRRNVAVHVGAAVAAPHPHRIRFGGTVSPREARLLLWSALSAGAKRLSVIDPTGLITPDLRVVGETAGVITRNAALFGPLERRTRGNTTRVEPAGAVQVQILESSEAIVVIGLNHSASTRRVKLTFPHDIPEAIWQDMEAGNAVHFVMGPDGPFYEHTFAPQGALVLAIRKKLR